MKATGIVRNVDSLGRVVLPKGIRKTLRIGANDPVEFFVDDKGVYIRRFDVEGDMEQLLNEFERKLRADGFVPQDKINVLVGKVWEMRDILSV